MPRTSVSVRCSYCCCSTSTPVAHDGFHVCEDCHDLLTDPGLIVLVRTPVLIINFTDLTPPPAQVPLEDPDRPLRHDL